MCSGIIFKEGLNVRGLNTAATIWCTAAIGVLCSSERLLYAAVATAVLLAGNVFFRLIAERIQPLPQFGEEENVYMLSVSCRDENEAEIRSAIMNSLKDARLYLVSLQSADDIGGIVEIEATVRARGRRKDEHVETLTAKVALEDGVTKAGWKLV